MTKRTTVPTSPAAKAEALLHKSHAIHQAGRFDEAYVGYQKITELLPRPTNGHDAAVRADALHLMGLIETARNRHGTAMDLIGEAITLNPTAHIYYTHLATTFHRLGLNDKAAELARRAVVMNPGFAFSHYNLATILAKKGDQQRAREEYVKALALQPNDAETLVSIGSTYHALGDFESAIHWYRRGAEVDPTSAQAVYNIGVALHDQARYEEALPYYERALALRPGYVLPTWNRGLTRLTLGNLSEGWEDFEARWQFTEQMREVSMPAKRFARPMWPGNTVPTRVHLHAEQGIGDTLQFARYATIIRDMGHDVRLEVPPPTVDLLRRSLSGDRLAIMPMAPDYPGGMGILDFDFHLPLMSIPRAMGTTLDTIPWSEPYLRADPEKTARWAARLARFPGLKVGLCWAGGKRTHDPLLAAVDGRRSISVETMRPIWSVPGVTFVSLQVGANAVGPGHTIQDWTSEIETFDDTAALIEALDLVISVDTSVVHVAGGLGKKVFMLNRYDTCWRWLRSGDTTKWYPSMTIIRQEKAGEWGSVVHKAAEMMRCLTS